MMYLSAAFDSGTDTDSVVREGPHRRTAEEMASSRAVEPASARTPKSTSKDWREEVGSSIIADVMSERTPFEIRPAKNVDRHENDVK